LIKTTHYKSSQETVFGYRLRFSQRGTISEFFSCSILCQPKMKKVTSLARNPGSIKDRAIRFACSRGFSETADRMVWSPSLSHDRKWPCVTKCTHSRVVGLRLEGSFVVVIIIII